MLRLRVAGRFKLALEYGLELAGASLFERGIVN